jgi:VWFA-related protein
MLAVLATVALAARGSAPPTETPQRPATPPRTPQTPVFRTTADAVQVDLQVRTAGGQFLPDLRLDEFSILEDGIPQKIQTLQLFHGQQHLNLLLPQTVAAPEGIIMPPSIPVADVSGRVFIFFIDDANIEFLETPRLRDALRRVIKTLFHDGDLIAMVSSGPSSVEVDPTYDLKRISAQLDKIAGNAMTPTDMIQSAQTSEGPAGLRYQASLAFKTAFGMLEGLEAEHSKRKAFIWVSSGYDFNPFPESRDKALADIFGTQQDPNNPNANPSASIMASNPFLQEGRTFSDADLYLEMSMLSQAANRSNTTFYTIDPRGLMTGMPGLDLNLANSSEMRDHERKTMDSLITLARLTGGFPIVNTNDLESGLKRIDNETSDYYILGYTSSNPDPLKKIRKIEVKVTRPGAVVVNPRQSYSLTPIPVIKKK